LCGSPVDGYDGGRLLVGVCGGAIRVVRTLAVAEVAALGTAGMGVVLMGRRLAVTTVAACLSMCLGVRFGWSVSHYAARPTPLGWPGGRWSAGRRG